MQIDKTSCDSIDLVEIQGPGATYFGKMPDLHRWV